MRKKKAGVNVKSAENGNTKKKLIKQLDKLWSEYVRGRDKGCVICGSTEHLQAHHIFSRRYSVLRHCTDNGVTLCFPHHHHLAHSLYEEFRDKIMEHIGEDKYNLLKQKSNNIVKFTIEDYLKQLEYFKKERDTG